MNLTWGALAEALRLAPSLSRMGPPRLRQVFEGRHAGARVEIAFDPAGVRVTVAGSADGLLSGDDDLRILPRAFVGGWRGGVRTGDAAFDEAVVVLADDEPRIRLRLDAPTRALLAEMIESGAWVTNDQVIIEPRATAAVADLAEARALVETAADLLRALRQSTPQQIVDMAFGDPAEPQRTLARTTLGSLSGDGARWAGAVIDALTRHHPGEGPELLTRIAPHSGPHFDGFLAACDRYPAESAPALIAALPAARSRGEDAVDAVVERIAATLVNSRRAQPDPMALARDPELVRALLARLGPAPAARRWLSQLPVGDEALQVELVAARPEAPEAIARALAGLRLRTERGEAAWIAAYAQLPVEVGLPALAELTPSTTGGRRALVRALCAAEGPIADRAVVDWSVNAPTDAVYGSLHTEAARRVCAALAAAPDHPLLARCPANPPEAFARALTAELVANRPRFGAGWLARLAPDCRSSDPEREARLLGVLAELDDPAGEPRCIAALEGSDFLRITAARALTRIGTARALPPLDGLTGFFAPSEVKAAARAAIDAIRERETRGPRGGLSIGAVRGGELSSADGE